MFVELPEDKYGTLTVLDSAAYPLARAEREKDDYWQLALYPKDAAVVGVDEITDEKVVIVTGLTEQQAKDAVRKYMQAANAAKP